MRRFATEALPSFALIWAALMITAPRDRVDIPWAVHSALSTILAAPLAAMTVVGSRWIDEGSEG